MRSLLVALLVLSSAPAFAQGGADLTPPPEVAPVTDLPPDPPAAQASDPERPPRYARPAPQRAYAPWPPQGTAPPGPRQALRAEREAIRLERRAHRIALRSERPWRLRLGLYVTASPRAINGFGPYDRDDRWVYPGLGVSATLSRWLTTRARVDLDVGLAHVFGDYYSSGDHGAEGSLGGAFTMHSRGRFRIGGGLSAAVVIARELDEATGGHFGWTGFRFGPVAEIGWFTTNDRGVSLRLSPTFTWAPYDQGVAPGVIFGVGVEI